MVSFTHLCRGRHSPAPKEVVGGGGYGVVDGTGAGADLAVSDAGSLASATAAAHSPVPEEVGGGGGTVAWTRSGAGGSADMLSGLGRKKVGRVGVGLTGSVLVGFLTWVGRVLE